MATYYLPQVLVFQDFQTSPATAANPLNAHISGGHAKLVRYSNTDEREVGFLGYYDGYDDSSDLWPARPAGGIVDQDYTKVFIKDALLKYASFAPSTNAYIGTAGNIINSQSDAYALGFGDRLAALNRDVEKGDIAKVSYTINEGTELVNVWTTVKDVKAGSIARNATASDDVNNAQAAAKAAVVTKIGGPSNCMVMTADATDMRGEVDGFVTDSYTVTITQSSVGNNLPTARMRVVSASGLDDVTSMIPGADNVFSVATPRGMQFRFTFTTGAPCLAAALADGVPSDALVAGQSWAVAATQSWIAPSLNVTAAPTAGIKATNFVIEVVRGGAFDAVTPVLLRVSTDNGAYPTFTVPFDGTPVSLSAYGPTVDLSDDFYRKGDRYYVAVTVTENYRDTLVLSHNVASAGNLSDGDPVSLDLFIKRPLLEVPRQRSEASDDFNWTQSDTEITLIGGLTAFDATNVTSFGALVPMDVVSEPSKEYGKVYVEFRTWLSTLANEVNKINDVGQLDAISGALHPDNPLKWGVFKALSNSNGTAVGYTAVNDPVDTDEWVDVLELLLGRTDTYGLVPLTNNRTVQDLYAAHVDAMSSPEQGQWRVAWFGLQGIPTIPVVHNGSVISGYLASVTTDGENTLGTFTDDSLTSGSQYTMLNVPTSNSNFETNGVRPGDIVRTLYTTDNLGKAIYSEFVVDEVMSEDSLRLLTGPAAPQTVPVKFEIWRNLTATEEAAEIARDAGSWGNRRIRAVWPDQAESGGTLQAGYFVAAALAGLSSGILPHQGMTRLEVAGFSDIPRTVRKFNRPQLDAMAVAGVWIVTQDLNDGNIFTRHAVTTGNYEDLNDREEMVTRNIDSISYRIRDHFEPFIGVSNVTESMRSLLQFEFGRIVDTLRTERATAQLGPQLIAATLIEVRPHTLMKDRFVLRFNGEIPYAMNSLEAHIVI